MKTSKRKREAAPAAGESRKAKTAAAAAPTEALSVVLASHCSVKDAASLKASLCTVLNESETVTLDVSGVERIDTATMQLLCAFVRDRAAHAQRVRWQGSSGALNEAARLLGVGDMLAPAATGAAA